ncbi:hypothetical protein AX15_007607 [Amanita polypyramis BW_CC]|nr:hypothetical protein AX15_007607 [Amanita polypyramis BW_CC]
MSSSPYFTLQKRQILRALCHISDLVVDTKDEGCASQSTNQVAYHQLYDLVEGTVLRGEGNSCLLLGPRGSGKTTLLNKCLSELAELPIVLRLSGWVQTTDRLALREIALQLNEQTGNVYLAPTEDNQGDEEHPPLNDSQNPSTTVLPSALPPASQLPTLISLLPTLSRPTIVILDAFDLFSLHPRQSLLYCLLDTVQSCRAGSNSKGVAVIGLTSRMDSVNLLEKRVKSRFSGRMLRTASPRGLDDWIHITRAVLYTQIPPPHDVVVKAQLSSWNEQWNSAVDKFLADESVLEIFNDTFTMTKDVRVLSRLLTHLILHLSPSSPFLSASKLASAATVQRSRPTFPFLYDMPYPFICLLVAVYHWDTAGQSHFTFEMLYESFRNQVRASSSAPVQVNGGNIGMMRCSRQVMMTTFECLVSAHIFLPVGGPNSITSKEFVKHRCALERDDIKKAADKCGQTNVKKWLNKAQ